MTRRLILSPEAEQDILAILEYGYETWGEEKARAYLAKLDHSLENLKNNPFIGRKRPDISSFHRAYLIEQHILIYFVDNDCIYISRLFHQSRDIFSQNTP